MVDALGHAVLVGRERPCCAGLGPCGDAARSKICSRIRSRSGYFAAILAGLAGLALLAIIIRELAGLARLASVDTARDNAVRAIESDDRNQGQPVVSELLSLTRKMPNLARGRARLESHRGDIIDGRDLVLLTERELMAPLDQEARRLIGNAAKRVSVITAVSARAPRSICCSCCSMP